MAAPGDGLCAVLLLRRHGAGLRDGLGAHPAWSIRGPGPWPWSAWGRASASRSTEIGLARRNTDDNLYLEFSSPLGVARSELGPIFAALDRERATFASLMPDPGRLAAKGRQPAALLDEYRRAKSETIRLQGELAQADAALANYRRALKLQPRLAGLHRNFGRFLVEQRRYREAALVLELGLAGQAADLPLMRQLAWLRATTPQAELRDPWLALRLARAVDRATGGRVPSCLDTLAAALAADGDFDDAVATAERALRQAQALGEERLAAQIEGRLELYRRGRAFQLPPDHGAAE